MASLPRPNAKVAGYQTWGSLSFLHWEVNPSQLRALLPEQLELDLYRGSAYVGLVPFAMRDIRPAWCRAGLGFNFLETNVRTYVRLQDRPGVYFFSLDANSRIAVTVARWGWSLPYYVSRMSLSATPETFGYSSRRGRHGPRLDVTCQVGAPLGTAAPGSLEEFLVERYLLFVQRRGTTLTGQVHHQPYPIHAAHCVNINDELVSATGLSVSGMPDLVHHSPGVEVEVFPLTASSR